MVVVPARMGRINKRTLVSRLQRLGVASRADLAKSLGMSQPTAGKIVEELLEQGLIEEVSALAAGTPRGLATRVGRPGQLLRLDRSKPRFLGIQLGVSETSIALLPVGVDAEDHWTEHFKTPRSDAAWLAELCGVAARNRSRNFWGVLVSVPGIVDESTGVVLFSPNLHWTEQVDLAGMIHQVWEVPVVLVQEERALALGHQRVNPTHEDFLLVDFGDGVGGAVIVGGKLYTHPLPISGELGHTPVLGNARACGCGATGCLETLVSTRGLLQSLASARRKNSVPWPALVKAIEDDGVAPWLEETLQAAAVVIAGALNVLGLRRVVITGSLCELPQAVMDCLSAAIRRGSMWARFGSVEVEGTPRRRTAGLVAVGIDRLVLPVAAQERSESTAPAPAIDKT